MAPFRQERSPCKITNVSWFYKGFFYVKSRKEVIIMVATVESGNAWKHAIKVNPVRDEDSGRVLYVGLTEKPANGITIEGGNLCVYQGDFMSTDQDLSIFHKPDSTRVQMHWPFDVKTQGTVVFEEREKSPITSYLDFTHDTHIYTLLGETASLEIGEPGTEGYCKITHAIEK